jgi:hypothetical protein
LVTGTLVHTQAGTRTIDAIQLGDLVLAQDGTTGRLEYKPVLAVSKDVRTPLVRITLEDGRSLGASGLARVWQAGTGWVRVSALQPGDRIRRIGGVIAVRLVEKHTDSTTYNLDVADLGSYFAGTEGILVHDNGLVESLSVRFDRPDLDKP